MVSWDDDDAKASFERVMVARAAIIESGAKPRTAGKLLCPVCKAGQLHWSMASNRHVWARCTTEGCVCWLE